MYYQTTTGEIRDTTNGKTLHNFQPSFHGPEIMGVVSEQADNPANKPMLYRMDCANFDPLKLCDPKDFVKWENRFKHRITYPLKTVK